MVVVLSRLKLPLSTLLAGLAVMPTVVTTAGLAAMPTAVTMTGLRETLVASPALAVTWFGKPVAVLEHSFRHGLRIACMPIRRGGRDRLVFSALLRGF